jgi:hypothetical protein
MTGDSRSAALPSWSQLKAIADGQRMVLWALLIGTLAALATVGAGAAGGAPDLVGYLFLAVVIGVRGWMALSVYRLSKALGSKVAILWAIGGFLPNLIGLVVLAVLSGRATGRLKKAGLRVGLLGARLPSEPPPGFACQETVGQFA